MNLHTGDENGIKPKFAIVSERAIVAKGALCQGGENINEKKSSKELFSSYIIHTDRALPIFVRRSSVIPNVDKSNTADNTNVSSQ